jgi:hypothetical protein
MFALERFHDSGTYLLLEAAGNSLGVLLVESFPLKAGINALLNCLPKPGAFGCCQGNVVDIPKFTDHTVKPMWRPHTVTP